jgi:hypothetical protein
MGKGIEKDIEKLKNTSLQELFNIMWNGLKAQGWKMSIDTVGGCSYRSEIGACAIGYCIGDKTAKYWDDMSPIQNTTIEKILAGVSLPVKRRTFLVRAQEAHDGSNDPSDMKSRFIELADTFDLTIPKG